MALFERVAIVGVGLIGGSLGLALRQRLIARSVVGVEVDTWRGAAAVAAGAVDECADFAEAVAGADLIVLAAPVEPVIHLMGDYEHLYPLNTIVTDVCSSKHRVVLWGDHYLPGRFVGGHPMAGSEHSGVEAARADLFDGATWALTPTEKSVAGNVERLEELIEAVGAKPLLLPALEHDRTVALTSHLPHLLAYALSSLAQEQTAQTPQWRELTAGSWNSVTRVARSSPALWAEILVSNRSQVRPLLQAYRDQLDDFLNTFTSRDDAELLRLLQAGHDAARNEGPDRIKP